MLGRVSTLQPGQGCSGKFGHTIAWTIWLEGSKRIFKDVIAHLDNLWIQALRLWLLGTEL